MRIGQIGVIGAGVMGRGVAQNAAQVGMEVVLIDSSEAALEAARLEIRRSLRFHGMLAGKGESSDAAEVIERIRFEGDLKCLQDVDYLVENIIEKWEAKRDVFQEVDKLTRDEVVFAANTSCIPITRIASATTRPAQVIGIHFMNPVPLKATVEVIRGYHTSEGTLCTTKDFLSILGKDCIVVQDGPGFVTNRILMLTVNEAIGTVHDKVASAEDVDRIFKECFGHPMGPLETADLIGLDTILYSVEALYESFSDSKYRPSPLLRQYVDAGRLGRKSGAGFYEYGRSQTRS